jgi:1,4-dihydroxy-2-naphthoate octaprenyltransferase
VSDPRPSLTAATATPQPAGWAAWKQALRLPSFSATLSPIVIGSSLALVAGTFDPALVILMLAAAIACQAGANLANDYYDHHHGVDTIDRPGSSKVIQQGLLTASEIKRGMLAAFTIATTLGLVIVASTGWAILFLALGCLAVAVFYTAGPKPLGYVALGEAAVFLTMGLALATGSFLALTGSITASAFLIALPNACLVTAILHVNNMRDIARDRDAGKRTLAMTLSRQHANRFYASLIVAAYLLTFITVAAIPYLWPILCVVVTAPRATSLIRTVADAGSEAEFGLALRGGNRLLLEFGLLMSAGLVIVAVFGR